MLKTFLIPAECLQCSSFQKQLLWDYDCFDIYTSSMSHGLATHFATK